MLLKSTALIALILTIANGQQASSFWFTDTSLFRPPAIQVEQVPAVQQQANAVEKLQKPETSSQSSGPWVQVGEQQQQQRPSECSCNLDWIQNQTSSWLNKWLRSADGTSQMRLLLSNSTGATSNINRRERNNDATRRTGHESAGGGTNNNIGNHWARSKGNNELPLASSVTSKRQTSQTSLHGRHRGHGQQVQQGGGAGGKLVHGPRGPQGPKGDTGPRGERGEPGSSSVLLRVKDRDALFDLASQQQNNSSQPGTSGNNNSNSIAQLVFVEADQMLVVRTELGWRPVQMLPALVDFRKTIPRFSLNSEEQRRQLMSIRRLGGDSKLSWSADNSIQATRPSRLPSIETATGSRRAIGVKTGGRNNQMASIDDEDIDLDEGEDEDDDDGIDDGEDVDEDDEEEDDDEDDDAVDDDEFDSGNADDETARGATNAMKRNLVSGGVEPPAVKLISTANPEPAPRRSPVSARSAAAALVSASIDDSSPVSLKLTGSDYRVDKRAPASKNVDDASRIKLRLAALNEPFSGNIHGIRGADFECKRNAAKANIKGSFRAFLASGFQNLNEVVRQNVHKYPVVNMRGETLANSWHDLFKRPARVGNPLGRIYSFDGRHVATDSNWPNKLVWHGASSKTGHRDLNYNCDGWHSDFLSKFGYASPLHPPRAGANKLRRQRKRRLAETVPNYGHNSTHHAYGNHEPGFALEVVDKYPCRMPLIVLCIETIGQQSQSEKTSFVNSDELESNMVSR